MRDKPGIREGLDLGTGGKKYKDDTYVFGVWNWMDGAALQGRKLWKISRFKNY